MIIQGFEKDYQAGLTEVFFLTAQQDGFADENERTEYYQRWAGQYIERYPDWVFLAVEDGAVLGYLLGCPDTREALNTFDLPGMESFTDLLQDYPAHLHINVRPNTHGKGIGRKLIASYCSALKRENIPGVHLVTTGKAQNAGFYQKVGFDSIRELPDDETTVLFMGKRLSS